ncbi:MAG: PAS domain S-box protein, partial [Asgard group archaeon]|nr:PAS domain S-box protein [Asgard group archaeon]
EEKFRVLAESSLVGMAIFQDDQLKYVNDALAKINGYSKDEMSNWTTRDVLKTIYTDDLSTVKVQLTKKQKGEIEGIIPHYTFRLVTKTNQIKWVENFSRTILYRGQPADFISMIDITDRKQKEEENLRLLQELKESEERLRRFYNTTKEAIFASDPNARLLLVNPAAASVLGYDSPDELIGMSTLDFFVDSDQRKTIIQELMEKGSVDDFELVFKKKDGTFVYGLTNASMHKDEEGNILQTEGFIRDVTELKRAELALRESEREKAAILDSLTDFVLFYESTEMKIVWANRAAAKDANLPLKELIGKQCYKIWHQRTQPCEICPVSRCFKTHQPEEDEILSPDGRVWVIKGFPVISETGDLIGVVEITRNITEQKYRETENLQLVQKLQKVNFELEKTNQELQEFAYIVSHDLKAPLRGIHSLAEFLKGDYYELIDDKGREYLELLMDRIKRLDYLIHAILEYSRIGRVQKKLVDINLNDLLTEVIDLLAPPENIQIKIDCDLPTMYGERIRVSQIFQNLLSNAIKFMDKSQGVIKVDCKEEDDYWQFSVADNGPGIEEKHFKKIFQMFQTLNSRDNLESTGAGLAICKKIVEYHNGKIWVESELNEGSKFLFTLPKQL